MELLYAPRPSGLTRLGTWKEASSSYGSIYIVVGAIGGHAKAMKG